MDKGRSTVPSWLNPLTDDRLDHFVVFAVLDERLDGSIDVAGRFTAVEDHSINFQYPGLSPLVNLSLESLQSIECRHERLT